MHRAGSIWGDGVIPPPKKWRVCVKMGPNHLNLVAPKTSYCNRTSVLFIYWGWQLPSDRRHGVFGYPKQSATVSVGSVLEWRAATKTRWRQVVFMSRYMNNTLAKIWWHSQLHSLNSKDVASCYQIEFFFWIKNALKQCQNLNVIVNCSRIMAKSYYRN
jgi:hypothetical protein